MWRAVAQVVKSFRLKLQVADMGGMGLTSEAVAIIHVSDINNHAPRFTQPEVSTQCDSCHLKIKILLVFSWVLNRLIGVLCVVRVAPYESAGEPEGL